MSREYTFDTTLRNITKEDVDNVVERLIDAERIVVGPDFYSGDYVLIFGAAVGSCYFPRGAIDCIDIHYVRDIVPTKIILKRRNTLKNTINSVYGLNSALRDVRNKQDLIKDVIFNNPATIVYWVDGTKTVVKAHNEKFDPEKGLAMAICKRFLGSNKSGSNFNNIFKKWLPEQKESNSDTNIKDYEKNEPLRWMTVAEVAEELGCSKALVQEECRKGLYPGAFKENGKWLIPVPLLEEKRGNKNE
jgi:hypothetical protein